MGFPVRGDAALLRVFSINRNNSTYVNTTPYVQWSASAIQNNTASWVPADQFLLIQTDQQYHFNQNPAWAVQVYTDNTDSSTANGLFNLPDWWVGSTFHNGGTLQGPVPPVYKGYESYSTGGTNFFPKNGLIAADGQSRLPLIWRFYDVDGPPGNNPTPIVENVDKSNCDFQDCSWAFFLDKGDLQSINGGPLTSNWDSSCAQNDSPPSTGGHYCYTVPLSENGGQYAIANRWKPTYSGDGTVSQELYLASNFRNGTRQIYSTTVFVELLTF